MSQILPSSGKPPWFPTTHPRATPSRFFHLNDYFIYQSHHLPKEFIYRFQSYIKNIFYHQCYQLLSRKSELKYPQHFQSRISDTFQRLASISKGHTSRGSRCESRCGSNKGCKESELHDSDLILIQHKGKQESIQLLASESTRVCLFLRARLSKDRKQLYVQL